MIRKADVVLLLKDIGEDKPEVLRELYASQDIPLNILKKINDQKSLDVLNFYEKLRKSYNHKKSKLYINIVKSDETENINAQQVLTTLSALLNQILQYEPEDKVIFLKHVRAEEIAKVLTIYFTTFKVEPAVQLLKLIKADLCVLENVSGRRKI